MGRKCTVSFTNIPGPQTELQWNQRKLHAINLWVPNSCRQGCALGFGAVSYADTVSISINVDQSVYSRVQAQEIASFIRAELDAISVSLSSNPHVVRGWTRPLIYMYTACSNIQECSFRLSLSDAHFCYPARSSVLLVG